MAYEYGHVSAQRISDALSRVFGWMAGGLALTGLTAYAVAGYPPVARVIFSPAVVIPLVIAQFALVIAISWGINKMSATTGFMCYIAYAFLTGLMLSSVFMVYTDASIVKTFLVSAGMFGGAALYGYVTRADLSALGSLLGMMLWGLVLAMIANMWFQSDTTAMMLSYIAVVIFTGLTAYDIQKIKSLIAYGYADDETVDKIALIGALTLYLDFVNLFLNLLQIMGEKKSR